MMIITTRSKAGNANGARMMINAMRSRVYNIGGTCSRYPWDTSVIVWCYPRQLGRRLKCQYVTSELQFSRRRPDFGRGM
jgi:hypothetical protein